LKNKENKSILVQDINKV